jgi:hypothetical protein
MHLSIMHILLVIVVVVIGISTYKNFRGDNSKDKKPDVKKEKKGRNIVGHEQATPMAVRTVAPAFAEETDWSVYEQPSFLRNKKQKTSRKRNTQKAEAPVEAKPAERKQTSTKPQRRQTPQQQMEEFRENVRNRSNEQPAGKAAFVEV